MKTDFVALYRGRTVAEARLVAVTADPELVAEVVRSLVGEEETEHVPGETGWGLELVRDEAEDY